MTEEELFQLFGRPMPDSSHQAAAQRPGIPVTLIIVIGLAGLLIIAMHRASQDRKSAAA